MRITLIGHSTVLLEMRGLRVLSDPYFGTWGNPAYRRRRAPAWVRGDVGSIDLVLVSHNHWDHTDRRFFRSLPECVPVVAPGRVRLVTKLKGARRVLGMREWEERVFGRVTVTAVPALHLATTSGYVLQSEEYVVYFAGDTYHRPFMREIGARFPLDVALMPVTTYRIPMTMGERGAVAAVRDLGAATVIPVHLCLEPRFPLLRTRQTAAGFARRVAKAGLPTNVVVLAPGESWTPAARPVDTTATAN